MRLYLSGEDWEIKGFDQYVPIKETSMETGIELAGITGWIQSNVPGGVHSDLYRSGIIPNPTKDLNSYSVEWVERRWWMYKKMFDFDMGKGNYNIVFEGIDYECFFYLNGVHIGNHIGMFTKAVFDISEIVKEKNNTLVVVFKHSPDEMGQIGYTSKTSTVKSRFNYKWDFSARIVNIGIWQDVYIEKIEDVSAVDTYIKSNYDNEKNGIIDIDFKLIKNKKINDDIQIQYKVTSNIGDVVCDKTEIVDKNCEYIKNKIIVSNPMLWDVNGSGRANLYTVEVNAIICDKKIELIKRNIGIRSISYEKNDTPFVDALPYTFVINGKKVYIKGINITPIDTMYGDVKKEQYEQLIRQAVNANINLIRVWGGGLIEKEIFYDLCDQNGILVWQDFIQSSSGIDNQPSHDSDFLELLKEAATEAIKEKRNHTSLACWCGGNELMDYENVPVTYDDKNIAMLKSLVNEFNPEIFFYPSTASGPTEFLSKEKENHDIHGGWEYKGNPMHYEYYGSSNSLYHSEFGTEGPTSLKNMRKFVSKKFRYPSEMNKNEVYRNHGAWWGTYRRDTKMFFELDSMIKFVDCGQYLHAEGLRFILEANRRRKFENSGSMIWQLNEPFPNVSCTCLIDYFGECKPVYYYAKRSYRNKHISLKYKKLNYEKNENFKSEIYVHNSLESFDSTVKMYIHDVYGNLLWEKEFKEKVKENSSNGIGMCDYVVDIEGLFVCTLELYKEDMLICDNRYVFSTYSEQPYKDFGELNANVEIIKEEVVKNDVDENKYITNITIKNIGDKLAPLSGIQINEDCYYMICDDNYFDLLPNEEKIINATVYGKKVGSFLYEETFDKETLSPTFNVRFFGKKEEE